MNSIFITGGTGYVGRPLIAALIGGGHAVHALVRAGSESKLPAGAIAVRGNALDESTFSPAIPAGATLVHLVGTPHPNPRKAAEFQRVDLASIRASVAAARESAVGHFVYVSVAHPAPIMRAYIAARQEGEALVRTLPIPATILRPWYVLGPGHYWPYLLVPAYAILRRVARTKESAERLGLVTREAMVAALVQAIDSPPPDRVRVVDVPHIRSAGTASAGVH
jgi:uncharacterized protein YbjT (DUF2867 family)